MHAFPIRKFFLCCGLVASFAAHADTFMVTNTASSGPGSLAQAMQDAYNNFGGTTNIIVFNIPGPGVHTIVPQGLPLLNNTLIDGYTQPGAQPNTLTNGDNAVLLVEVRGQLSLFANCTVRGLVINSSGYAGVSVQGNGVIEGNFLGTDPSGTVAIGNTYYGVYVEFYVESANVRIGGAAPAARNVISGNRLAGIGVNDAGTNTVIQGNLIGTDVTGARPLGNSLYGVVSYSPGVSATKIGGTNTGEGNVIAFNGLGVWIEGGQGCSILGNAIFANKGLGIDLGYGGAGAFVQPDGPTPNHPGGINSGPNLLENHPLLTNVVASAGTTTVQGTLNSFPNGAFRLEFFANDGPDAAGYGQGRTFLGSQTVTTDRSGNANFTATFQGTYQFIAATSTDAAGNTSEFSPNLPASLNQFAIGDLLIGLNDGLVQWRHPDGTLAGVLDPGFGWNNAPQGMAFDRIGNLYVTGQSNFTVVRFAPSGQPLGVFSTNQYGYSSDVELDAAGNVWVCSEFGDSELAQYDANGRLLAEYNPDLNLSGLYRFQLGSDQRTAYYDGTVDLFISNPELSYLGRYDLASGQGLPVLYLTSTNVNAPGVYGFRLLPDGGALLTTPAEIRRVNALGQIAQVYDAPGEAAWDPLALDADGRSFWAGSSSGPLLYKFDIASGALLQWMDTGASGGVASAAVYGQPSAADASLFLGITANAGAIQAGEPVTYTLTLLNFRTNAATGVRVTDTMPAGVTFNSATTSLGSFTQAGNAVTFHLDTVPAGGTVTMSVAVTPGSPGNITNSAAVTAQGADPNPAGHFSSYATRVQPAAGPLLVVNANDSGAGSLRAAIQAANAAPGLDTISFNLPGPGPHVIQLASPLPPITDPVVIDGYTQPGASANTSGTTDNAAIQLVLDGGSAGPSADGLILAAGQSMVRGVAIGNFSGSGVVLAGGQGNLITGNFIGTDALGTAAHPNGRSGILIRDSLGNTIGGLAVGSRNIISGNGAAGVGMTGDYAGANVVQGNFIGTDSSGAGALGNGLSGVLVSAPQNLIGGTNAGAGNVIAFNGRAGVEVYGVPGGGQYDTFVTEDTKGVGIMENSIYANAALGIDLAPPGVTLNDAGGDYHSGPNGLLNFPVVSPITPGSTTVQGTLATIPSSALFVELFANTAPDPSGYGQGQTIIGAAMVTTDTNGNAGFSVSVTPPLAAGQWVTATATAMPGLDTSEFSRAVRVSPAADLAVTIAASANPAQARQNLTYTITVTNQGPGSASGVLLTDVLPQPATFVSADGGGTNSSFLGQVGWPLGTLAAGASTNLHFVVAPTLVGPIRTTASVQATEFEPTPSDNQVSLTTQVTGLPRTLQVSNTNDEGAGSLRAALTDLNANGYGLDTITFNIPGAGAHTITPSYDLPAIQIPVVIDGYTQPGAQPNTLAIGDNAVVLIELQGTLPPNPNTISGVNGLSIGVGNTTVRGLAIDRFRQDGIYVSQYGAPVTNNVVIEGNFIGIPPDGSTPVTNGLYGIEVDNMGSVQIGGTNPAARNLICRANTFDPASFGAGVWINSSGPVTIQGNFIGADASGQLPLGNVGPGVNLYLGDDGAVIGGTNAGAGNVVAYNNGPGVVVGDGTNNAVLGNSIFANASLGIQLSFASPAVAHPTPNHSGVASGPNGLQNYPVLTSVSSLGGSTRVQGILSSLPNTAYRLEFFANTQPHPSFHGQGQTFLGAGTVMTDGSGNATFDYVFLVVAANVAATATDRYGNTSEFSATWLPPAGAFQPGDIFIGDVNGQIQWRRHDGSPVKLLDTGLNSRTYGLGLDAAGRLVAAEGDTNVIVSFDNHGNLLETLSSNVVTAPQSIAFDSHGNFYVGNSSYNYYSPGGSIWKFGPAGTLLGTFNVAGEVGGAGWLDLAADQRTILYTSYGIQVKRYDVSTLTQLPDLTDGLPGYEAYDLRILPGGGVLVADGQYVVELNSAGTVIRTYEVSNDYSLAGLALDPDGGSFWASSQTSPYLYKFVFGTTNSVASLPVFTSSGIAALALYGEPRAAASSAPRLSIALDQRNAIVSWPAGVAGYYHQYLSSLASSNWLDLAAATNRLVLPTTNTAQFFRLIKR
jgi:uncharacterized repeat protein (TIGR01451 family)